MHSNAESIPEELTGLKLDETEPMKHALSLLIFICLFNSSSLADVKESIAALDKAFVETSSDAKAEAFKSKAVVIDQFLKQLTMLENSYRRSGNAAAVLAYQKVRAKYDPTAPKVNRPTIIEDQLVKLVSALEKELNNIDRKLRIVLVDAKTLRARKLMEIQRDLVKRDQHEESKLIIAALKNTPEMSFGAAEANQTRQRSDANVEQEKNATGNRKSVEAGKIVFLTFDRPKIGFPKRTGDSGGPRIEVSRPFTTKLERILY